VAIGPLRDPVACLYGRLCASSASLLRSGVRIGDCGYPHVPLPPGARERALGGAVPMRAPPDQHAAFREPASQASRHRLLTLERERRGHRLREVRVVQKDPLAGAGAATETPRDSGVRRSGPQQGQGRPSAWFRDRQIASIPSSSRSGRGAAAVIGCVGARAPSVRSPRRPGCAGRVGRRRARPECGFSVR
jgi:hypothetical protein